MLNLDTQQRFCLQRLLEAKGELEKKKSELALFEEEAKGNTGSVLILDAIRLRRQADIKDAEHWVNAMKDAVKTATMQKYKVLEELEAIYRNYNIKY